MPFTFIMDTRASGKTYGVLKELVSSDDEFIFMRRTDKQIKACASEELNPFTDINLDLGTDFGFVPVSKTDTFAIYERELVDGKLVPKGNRRGVALSLSGIANLRGFSGTIYKRLFYDEFVPEAHVRKISDEGFAFKNAIETINRNRELKGSDPIQVICCANSDVLANDILMAFNLVNIAYKCRNEGKEYYINRERGVGMFFPISSPIAKAKQNTALYKACGDSDEFTKMALGNVFMDAQHFVPSHKNLIEYKAVVTVGEITVYKHKSERSYYVTTHRQGTCPLFQTRDIDLARFKRAFGYVWIAYLRNEIEFEEYSCEVLLTKYFK